MSRATAICSSLEIWWELPPLEVLCPWDVRYEIKINSSDANVDLRYKEEIDRSSFYLNWIQNNNTYSVQLNAVIKSTEKTVGSPWRQEVTVIPSGEVLFIASC